MIRRLYGIVLAFCKRQRPQPNAKTENVSHGRIANQLVILAAQENWPKWKLDAALAITAKEEPYDAQFQEWDRLISKH